MEKTALAMLTGVILGIVISLLSFSQLVTLVHILSKQRRGLNPLEEVRKYL